MEFGRSRWRAGLTIVFHQVWWRRWKTPEPLLWLSPVWWRWSLEPHVVAECVWLVAGVLSRKTSEIGRAHV